MTDLDTRIANLRADVTRLGELQDDIARRSRAIAHELRAAGLNNIQIAARMGVSRQRVGQLLASLPTRPEGAPDT